MEHVDRLAGRLLRIAEVRKMTGLSKSTLYARIAADTFPRPINLGPRAVAWVESEVRQWIDHQVQASRQGAA